MLEQFIELKTRQLIYYASRYFRGRLPHRELHLFIWDTLEEWAQFGIQLKTPQNQQEQVFWHLLHQLEFWPEQQLKNDPVLQHNIQSCLSYLRGKGSVPLDCVGIRP
ncbi:hypothetical protein [Alkalimonas sp.]|uniref:hypothetical protein n=1 Tax=Alkalimonas sp. TaxID=1872453 RepID=UPI00263A8188|nr:hypothetical protein [Alkalimonas sp.]MCC5826744.1 hypothetical protein [Alkalimonas sp.]